MPRTDDALRRRELLAALAGALAAVATGCGGGRDTPKPRTKPAPEGFYRGARVSDLRVDDFRREHVGFPQVPGGQPVHLGLRQEYEGGPAEPVAFVDRCTHKGCPVRWVDHSQKFICPCHGGLFDKAGGVEGGPPKRPLDRLETTIADGVVYVAPRLVR